MAASKAQRISGWVVSGLVSALFCFSAFGKFTQPPEVVEGADKFGIPLEKFAAIGAVELACVVLYLIPKTAFLGSILLAAYLGGATMTHVRIGDPWFMAVLVGVVAWVGYGLRRPDVIKGAFKDA